jgi:hypothetical protein
MKELQQIAAISGKGGLYRVVKPTRSGVILETIDGTNKKIVANAQSRVSLLKEISIYTTSAQKTVLLEEVLMAINAKYPEVLPVTSKSSDTELYSFLAEIVPEFDQERVYASDIKKLVTWYNILIEHYKEIFVVTETKEV